MRPETINIYIVNNREINAYVKGGNNIFINTGLLLLSKDPEMLVGVIAHETGHIYGKHLLKGAEEARNTMIKSTVGYMLGLAATAAGSAQAGAAIVSGAQQVAQRQILKYTRGNEESADQSALNFLDRAGISSKGLLDLLQILYGKEVAMYNDINPYTLTHPLSRERVDHVKAHIEKSPLSTKLLSNDIRIPYARSIYKLDAYLEPSTKTFSKIKASDQSINARYARAIAYYRAPDFKKSLTEIDSLINDYPNDPYFIEFKGQLLFESGKVSEAITYYDKAKNMVKNSALLKIQLATAQIASENPAYFDAAILNLKQALKEEKENSFAWHQLAIAYGRANKIDLSNIALAEEALLRGDTESAQKFLDTAKKSAQVDSSGNLHIKDLESILDTGKDKKKDKKN